MGLPAGPFPYASFDDAELSPDAPEFEDTALQDQPVFDALDTEVALGLAELAAQDAQPAINALTSTLDPVEELLARTPQDEEELLIQDAEEARPDIVQEILDADAVIPGEAWQDPPAAYTPPPEEGPPPGEGQTPGVIDQPLTPGAQAAAARLSNTTRPGAIDFLVGDSFRLEVAGAAGREVTISAVINGADLGTTVLGKTDTAGALSVTGTMPASAVGLWLEVVRVGAAVASPILVFRVRPAGTAVPTPTPTPAGGGVIPNVPPPPPTGGGTVGGPFVPPPPTQGPQPEGALNVTPDGRISWTTRNVTGALVVNAYGPGGSLKQYFVEAIGSLQAERFSFGNTYTFQLVTYYLGRLFPLAAATFTPGAIAARPGGIIGIDPDGRVTWFTKGVTDAELLWGLTPDHLQVLATGTGGVFMLGAAQGIGASGVGYMPFRLELWGIVAADNPFGLEPGRHLLAWNNLVDITQVHEGGPLPTGYDTYFGF